MPFWVVFKGGFAPERPLDIRCGDLTLFGQRMDQDGHIAAMKEIQDTVIDAPLPCPQFIEALTDEVSLGTPELMAGFRQAPQADDAFGIGPAIAPAKLLQPLHDRRTPPLILVKVDLSCGHVLYLCL